MNSLVIFTSFHQKQKRFQLFRDMSVLMLGFWFTMAGLPAFAGEIRWDSLNLTPQQESQMDNLENDWHKVHQEVSAQIERDTAELRTILPTGDSQKIRQLQTRIMNNRTYLMKESMDTFLRKREMLSPAQRAQLQQMLPCNTNSVRPVSGPGR